jgi:hypothetical protein
VAIAALAVVRAAALTGVAASGVAQQQFVKLVGLVTKMLREVLGDLLAALGIVIVQLGQQIRLGQRGVTGPAIVNSCAG